MGKDQELLEAARNGNVPVVEKILNQRAKRSGPLASLRRGPGANVQDSSGYTPLHHAALNGHKEIVHLLLEHEASPNVPDAKGSSPLHLASWAGHVDIVRLLLTHGPALTNVNILTRDSESALHCAAQYGHTRVVAMLLNHGADPTVRSVRDETALDLACQYGRLETVELLVRTHPELLEPYRTPRGYFPHTPLHRASKNGHKAVVSVLLGAGFSPNTRTPSGTALHEAALCGKAGAARALLAGGADPRACDRQGLTVHDLLKQFPNHVTHDILSIINEYRMCNGFDSESEEHLPPIPVQEGGPGSPYDNVRSMQPPPQQRQSTRAVWERRDTESDGRRVSGTSAISIGSDGGHFPYSKSSAMMMMDGSYHSEELSSSYQSRPRDPDQLSISSTTSSTGGPSPRERQRSGTNESCTSGGGSYITMGASGYHAHSPGSNSKVSPTPPKKPPRRNLSVSPTHLLPAGGVGGVACGGCGGCGEAGTGPHISSYLTRTAQTRSQDDLDDPQEYKRMSRDMETETDPRFLGRCSSPSSSASTDHCVEEYVAEVPFAGLFKGSTTTLDGVGLRPTPAERPKSLRKLKSVYDTGGGGGCTGSKIEYHEDPRLNIAYQSKDLQDRDQSSNLNNTSLDKSLSILSPFDEQEEWAKISEIMASFGSRLVRESVFSDELEREFQARLGLVGTGANALAGSGAQMGTLGRSASSPAPNTLPGWLIAHSLPPTLETNFINNGYDSMDFINGVLEESDLAEMAIEEAEYTKVMEASKALPLKINDVMSAAPANGHTGNSNSEEAEKETDPEAVNKWLTSIGLECYQDTFRRHLYVDMERVRRIWEVELTAVLEIQKVGHRRRILASVAGRHNGPVDDIKNDLNNLQKNLQNLSAEINDIPQPEIQKPQAILPSTHQIVSHQITSLPPSQIPPNTTPGLVPPPTQSSGGETLKRSHKKNRPPPPPGPTRGADLEIRAPCELLVGVPGALRTQWRHQPFVLVTSSVMYVANYLGSTVVKELRGTESTQKSIQKLKKTNNEPRALPDIILSISYRGVKFLNTITRDLVCEHEIRNIHCACQDADDLTHFAYITKDNATKSHYCHVFCVATMDQATEVILTLGQAFEVAYQMALRELAPKPASDQTTQARSNSSNQISQQAKTPTRDKTAANTQSTPAKDRPNVVHGRSHSVTEIKLNGHRLKVAPIAASLSNEDFQSVSRNGDARKSPTSGAKAPIAVAEEL